MGKFKEGSPSIKGFSLEDLPFLVFGILFAPSLGSFYFTLGERIVLYFYGEKRKFLSYKQKWKEIFTYPSHCIQCNQFISFTALLPILGYFLTKKKCPHCGFSIHWIYPLSELGFLALFLISFFITKNFLFSLLLLLLFGHVLVSMITDFRKKILDYENLFFLLPLGLLSMYLQNGEFPNLENLYVGLGFFVVYLGIYFFKPESIGLGDVFYAPVYALILGHPYWMIFLNTSYILAVLFYFIAKKLGQKPSPQIPMGFYFGWGFLISMISTL